MNNTHFSQIPEDEQAVARELASLAQNLLVPAVFQSKLETQLVEAHRAKLLANKWRKTKIFPTLAWATLAVCTLVFLNWAVRTLIPAVVPATAGNPDPINLSGSVIPTENYCRGQLAAAHGFSVFLTNEDQTGFIDLDEQNQIGELRSLARSPDTMRLAIVGNTRGSGNLYLLNPENHQLQQVITDSRLGYLMGAAWSHDGTQLITSEIDNNSSLYFITPDGAEPVKKDLPVQFFETPQFAPDDESLLFYGADESSAGLFQVMLDSLQVKVISTLVEDEGSFAWSQDGSRLAYFEMDRIMGEARLVVDDQGNKAVVASFPIPTGSGSSIPTSANLSWSPDGKSLVFDFGRYVSDRSVYLVSADGTGFVKIAGPAHAPAISGDGKCLAYIAGEQVFQVSLSAEESGSNITTPVLLAELTAGQGRADMKLDKLQWLPETASP